jgi:antitoxin component of MazEF toxin-antitoxin module
MEIKTKLKSIGGSLGIVQAIPSEFIKENNLSKDQDITLQIKLPSKAGALFGLFRELKDEIDVKKLHEETDKGWKDD